MSAVYDISESRGYKVDPFKGSMSGAVSKQWISRPADQRFLSLNDLHKKVASRANASREEIINSRSIEFVSPVVETRDDVHRIAIALPNGDVLAPNHWSFGQLCSLAGAPASYLRRQPSQHVADCLTYDLRYSRKGDGVKGYVSGDDILAVTGVDYGRIYDLEVVEAVQQIAGNGTGDMRWKIPGVMDWRTHIYDPNAPVTMDSTTLYASDRDCFVFLVDDRNPIEVGKLPDGSPDLMFRGFYVSNSEVGAGSLVLAAFYLRAVCCNRLLWGVEHFHELRMRHTKYAPNRFIEEARPALESFANGSSSRLVEGVQKAKAAKIARDDDEAIEWLNARSFSRKKAMEILAQGEAEEGRPVRTAWDMAQALTANARNEPNNDSRITIEGVAKKLLDKVAA